MPSDDQTISPSEDFPQLARPDGALRAVKVQPIEALANATLVELVSELASRLAADGLPATEDVVWLGCRLQNELRRNLDIHLNRFARRRYRDLFGIFHAQLPRRPQIDGATYVDLGCGGLNPGGLLMVFLALGARRGIGIDLDAIHDLQLATRALADVAALMLIDPGQVVWDTPITRQQVLQNLASFDLAALDRSEHEGIDRSRLEFRQESIYELSLDDGEADVVISNAFLEHIPDVERGIREIARITKAGGLSVHNIDMTDHRRYGSQLGPIEFLTEATDAPIVHYSNRVRLSQFVAMFERCGFTVEQQYVHTRFEVSPELRQSLAAPYRGMSQHDLEAGVVRLIARKR